MPWTRATGDPNALPYQKNRSILDGHGQMSRNKRPKYSRIVKPFPFFFGKEFTELAVADSNSLEDMGRTIITSEDTETAHLVGAQLLHSVHILNRQVIPFDLFCQTLAGVLKVNIRPTFGIPYTTIAFLVDIRIMACLIRSKGIVELQGWMEASNTCG